MPNLWLICFITLSVFASFRLAKGEDELLAVHVVFRHGARAPIQTLTSAESRQHFYRGAGQLTDQGLKHGEVIGKILRDRYVNTSFLDKRMMPDEVFFRSSEVPRCLMTINRVADMMFPEKNPPIVTRLKKTDSLLVPKYTCHHIMKDYKKEFNLTDFELQKAVSNVWDISDLALQRAAQNTTYLKYQDYKLIPSLIIEKDAGLAVPSWFNDTAYEEALYLFYEAIAVMAGVGRYHHPSWIIPKSGELLHTIFRDTKDKVACTMASSCGRNMTKLNVYSTHDIVIIALLESLNIREVALGVDRAPDFAAMIIIEVWMIQGEAKVKVLFRPKPDETDLINLTGFVRNCPKGAELCRVDLFTSCCNDYVEKNILSYCLSNSPPTEPSFLSSIMKMLVDNWFILVVFCLLSIIIGLLVLILLFLTNRRNQIDSKS